MVSPRGLARVVPVFGTHYQQHARVDLESIFRVTVATSNRVCRPSSCLTTNARRVSGVAGELLTNMRIARKEVRSKDENPPPENSLDTRMAALKYFYTALDRVLYLIETASDGRPDLRKPINFYDEVKSFEISLIRQALRMSGGSQLQAAALLGLNATTLNSKVKNYSINCKNYADRRPRPSPVQELAGREN